MNKMWYTCIRECYMAIKKNGILLFAATQMKPEIVVVSEINHTQKQHMISQVKSK